MVVERSVCTGEEYYGEDGKSADVFGITSGWESKYSDLGFELERSNLGDGFEPASDEKGIVTAVFEYDKQGREIKRTFIDESGKEHNCIFGFSCYQVEYGEDGEIEKTAFRDEDGKEVTGLDGEVETVVLSMNNGDYKIEETAIGTLAFTPITYNVNRIAFHQDDKYDLMLQYSIPFNVTYDAPKIIAAALKRYAKALDNGTVDIKAVRDDGREIEDLLDKYLKTLLEGGNLMELFGNINAGITIKMLEPYTDVMPTEREVIDFYEEFYDRELEDVRKQLKSEYGEEALLHWQIKDMNEFSSSSIQAYNVELDRYGLDDIHIEDIINLEVEYTIAGNGKSGVLDDGFFYPRVTLLKFDNSWTFGTAEGFPSPDTKELAALFGIE